MRVVTSQTSIRRNITQERLYHYSVICYYYNEVRNEYILDKTLQNNAVKRMDIQAFRILAPTLFIFKRCSSWYFKGRVLNIVILKF